MRRALLSLVLAVATTLSLSAQAQTPKNGYQPAPPNGEYNQDEQAPGRGPRRGRVREYTNDDSMNLRIYPLALILGLVSVDLDFRIGDQWSIGPTLGYWSFTLPSTSSTYTNDFTIKQFRVGARANWFANGTFQDGLYVGPSIDYSNVKITTRDSGGEVTGTAGVFSLTAIVGYGWFWDSFNTQLGIGASLASGKVSVRRSNGTTEEVSGNYGSGLALEWSTGFKF